MAGSKEGPSSIPTFEGLAKAIDAVTNLYTVVAAKSPGVADTVVVLVVLLPFFWMICWFLGLSVREKQATQRIKSARKATKKVSKSNTGGVKK